jgi:hypothetical protein
MWQHRHRDTDSPVPCSYAMELRIAQEPLFARVTETTPKDTIAEALHNLRSHYQDLLTRMKNDTFHFPAQQTGRHWCVSAEFEALSHRLKTLSLMCQPPPVPPAPPPKPRSLRDVVEDFATETTEDTGQ